MTQKFLLTDNEWRQRLSQSRYRVLRQAGTEPPHSSPLNDEKRAGTFTCAGCGAPLYRSDAKFDAGCGWPSFTDKLDPAAITEHEDRSHYMLRTEIRCAACEGHLGHVFDDGPGPTGLRHCVNGLALDFKPDNAE